MSTNQTSNELPLLLRNLKKAFGQNIQGPIKNRTREFQITTKPIFIFDITKFMRNRGIEKLAAINSWKSSNDIKIAYHFIAKIGVESLDSKITIVTFLPFEERKLDSITSIFTNAELYEKEISDELDIEFKEKK